jgi:hypothetical protein
MTTTVSIPEPDHSADFADSYTLARRILAARGQDDHCQGVAGLAAALVRLSAGEQARLWAGLAAEAEHHGIAPLVQPVLAALNADHAVRIPADVMLVFVALSSRHRRASAARETCIDELLTEFAGAGIRVVLLKGAALAHLIYPAPSVRPMVDIDLLVAPADLERAINFARACGYSFAADFGTPFAGRKHHLPPATTRRAGFDVSLEIHVDAMSTYQREGLSLADVSVPLQAVRRGQGPAGLALGHVDMLRHLARHAFEPARRIRLVHLYDLWRYQVRFRDEIDWEALAVRAPQAAVVLKLVAQVFDAGDAEVRRPAGIGHGIVPFAELARDGGGVVATMKALFDPPAFWLHGFYGVPIGRSLSYCRAVRHPATLARWLSHRLAARVGLSTPGVISPRRLRGHSQALEAQG